MASQANSLVFSIPMWLTCSQSISLLCRDVDNVIILHFIGIMSMINSSLKDQHVDISFMTSAVVEGQQYITWVQRAPTWSPSLVAHLISSAVMHYGMSMHVSMASIFRLIPGISSSKFSLWLCLDRKSAMNNWVLACTGYLCCVYVDVVGFFVACVTGSPCPF